MLLYFKVYTIAMASEEVNWSLCCLCQTNGSGEIRCPAQSKHKGKGAGYESLSNALSQFKGSHSIPMNILNVLDMMLISKKL